MVVELNRVDFSDVLTLAEALNQSVVDAEAPLHLAATGALGDRRCKGAEAAVRDHKARRVRGVHDRRAGYGRGMGVSQIRIGEGESAVREQRAGRVFGDRSGGAARLVDEEDVVLPVA